MPDTNTLFLGPLLDPQIVALYQTAAGHGCGPADPLTLPLAEVRAAAERHHVFLNGDVPPMAEVRDVVADGPAGPLPLRLYRPEGQASEPLPVLVYFHGGGFVVNSVNTHDRLLRLLALHSGAVICAVSYSLAPERRFPHQHGEALAALHWVAREGAANGIDTGRIAVGGDSAGANLALSAALAARADGEPRVSFGLLLYGMFAHDFDTLSHRRFGNGRYGLTTERMRWYWRQYLGEGNAAAQEDPRAVPLLADLDGLPPMMLVAAELDCLRDDSLRLSERLALAGVPHGLEMCVGLPHSFATMTRLVDAADAAVVRAAQAVGRHLRA
ncbi:alpha/beta hydrolase [Azospirillum canadense]|uniref:alpha/beta hydrolase n=1 Tax=Azospirillum canadense TaxID=403962 RepID=UPI002227EA14|nr:alpha/beta hydrolase [Azospirillum canadense]MCW2239719.1 acetyl esterase [Azospirillum canadense]